MVRSKFLKLFCAGGMLVVTNAAAPIWAKDVPDGVSDVAPVSEAKAGPHVAAREPVLLNVLSYNIQGLPSPLKSHKTPLFERIAAILRERRERGSQPQVVLLQEAFDSDASIIAETSGYSYVLKGPGRKARSEKGRVHWAMQTRKNYMSFSDPQKITGSGLYILSDYPIVEAQHKAFDSDMCAGFDCLSNKAILLARIAVPGLDEPLDIINSHFNSRRSAKAPSRHVFRAHQRQTDTLSWFMDKLCGGYPVIVAGDFNTKQPERYEYFRNTIAVVDAAEDCLSAGPDCALRNAAERDNVLYDTNDKQFFRPTDKYRIIPTYIERNFTEEVDGRPLSDHLGYEVEYKILPLGNQTGKQQWALR
ncbi:endonuclease/exonuclease/phosphatase family protein [Kordiimonas aestuarii]|uniref:endonuclease/exonuclease/phosphatase family protein n=1 Tax=Kordiimonas aestuarii TaxID=1005925 RepID=UPI0021D0E7C4|nr:endonuclease/exonuclease/phosphatase family protein [Kordiimonas aestuarii]